MAPRPHRLPGLAPPPPSRSRALPAIGFTPAATPPLSSPRHWPRVPRPLSLPLASPQRPRPQSSSPSRWPHLARSPIGPSRRAACLLRPAAVPAGRCSLLPRPFAVWVDFPPSLPASRPAFCGFSEPGPRSLIPGPQLGVQLRSPLADGSRPAPFYSVSFVSPRLHSLTSPQPPLSGTDLSVAREREWLNVKYQYEYFSWSWFLKGEIERWMTQII